jgi:hypothetical protein
MKSFAQRRRLLTWTGVSALAIAAAWSYGWLLSSQEAAATARENLRVCLQLTAQIKRLREKPLRAGSEARSANELAHMIEISAQKANLSLANVIQIDPQPARRLSNSAYKEQPTHVELRDVTTKQLIVLLHTLAGEESGAELAELRLSAPRDEPALGAKEETWTAEATLTHLIFAP